ncbi:hypothetical protein [Roseovarius atlanticus]|uniref:hypothetical protein n=1 Tax=Roseovarius atlanticus TaxID=1641875 RepID=UPI001C964AB4|nr:hypothetical protein [Roseovarius atlanticus]MBY5988013.1 hypothetical protein [Roseovarius atlanticus]MBY6123404.1 hypothetical protein [Roseovarius atlanticus]MBY6147899.1 hypothetical protein [Roseovarius atlanticus]
MAEIETFPIEVVVICGAFLGMMLAGWLGQLSLALVLLGVCLIAILWSVIASRGASGNGAEGGFSGGADAGGGGDGGACGGGGE